MRLGEEDLQAVAASFLEPLAKASGVELRRRVVAPDYEALELDTEGLRIRVECERGHVGFSVGGAGSNQLWSIDALSSLFPRVRQLWGTQRFSLEEQISFIRAHWAELRNLFNDQNAEETNRQLRSHIGPNLQWQP